MPCWWKIQQKWAEQCISRLFYPCYTKRRCTSRAFTFSSGSEAVGSEFLPVPPLLPENSGYRKDFAPPSQSRCSASLVGLWSRAQVPWNRNQGSNKCITANCKQYWSVHLTYGTKIALYICRTRQSQTSMKGKTWQCHKWFLKSHISAISLIFSAIMSAAHKNFYWENPPPQGQLRIDLWVPVQYLAMRISSLAKVVSFCSGRERYSCIMQIT